MFLNSVDYSPSSMPIVETILECRRKEYSLMEVSFNEESHREKICSLERTIQKGSLPHDWDVYTPAGGFKLTEDISGIDGFVQKKFDSIRESGLIMYRSEFEKQEDPTRYRKPGVQKKEKPTKNGDLTRVWGAEYLRSELKSHEKYAVPRFLIVVEDGTTTLPITVIKDKTSLVIQQLDTEKGEILVEDIKDSTATCSLETHGWMKEIGYVDYADAGNIREKKGKYYVVDTEWKSLDGITSLVEPSPKSMEPSMTQLRRYASERFDTLYTDEWKKIVDVDLRF